MLRVTKVAALVLLALGPACAQPYYGGTPVYPGYGPAPYTAAPRYGGGGGHHHHYVPPRHHHAPPPHHHHGGHHHGGGRHHGGHHGR